MIDKYKYFAFISYSSKDLEWGQRLQRKLEHYRMPATLCNERGWSRTPIKPVFFAPTDIQPGVLSKELQERLQASRNLIVICSPNSAQSEWVGREIEFFYRLGRADYIHFFIVDGVPNSGYDATECFNPIIKTLGLSEVLGANIHEKIYRWSWLNRERAYVQLISKLLGVEFDTIWRRHHRLLIQKIIGWSAMALLIIAVIAGVWLKSLPVGVNVSLKEVSYCNDCLPPLENAVVTMVLDNEVKRDTIKSVGHSLVFKNVPQRLLNKRVNITFNAPNYNDVDTSLLLKRNVRIDVSRDSSRYGRVMFRLWDHQKSKGVGNVSLRIESYETTSDANGYVRLYIPLPNQKQRYRISSSVELVRDTLIMPCGRNDIVEVKIN